MPSNDTRPVASLTFSTDGLPAKDRFDHWVEERGRQLFGVTIELERERRPQFEGRFSAFAVGGATLVDMRASSYRVSRTRADIERHSSDSLYILQQVRGPGFMDTGGDRIHAVSEAAFVVSHSDTPYAGTPTRSDGFHARALKIPLQRCEQLARAARGLEHEPLAKGLRLTALLAAGFAALTDESAQLDAPDAAISNIAQLALIARGRAMLGSAESRAALQFGQYHAARQAIVQNLFRADLSPTFVASLVGVSVRQVHLLFEPSGKSFSQTLRSLRLAEAMRQLQADPARSVAHIAFSCGFDSLATFYRVFRQAYGCVPSDIRAQRSGG